MHIRFAELPVCNQLRAEKFYGEHFDDPVAADRPMGSDGWRWIELQLAEAEAALHFARRRDEASGTPVLVLVADDLEETVQGLETRGVQTLTEPREAPRRRGQRVAESQDSESNRLMIGGGLTR
jgi:predicted enzyme related to lactoylglutathione lyase